MLSWSTSTLVVATGVGAGDGCGGDGMGDVALTAMAESGMSGRLPPIGASERSTPAGRVQSQSPQTRSRPPRCMCRQRRGWGKEERSGSETGWWAVVQMWTVMVLAVHVVQLLKAMSAVGAVES